jgi:hypothetical protein
VSTVNALHPVVEVFPPLAALSLATTCHCQSPSVNPCSATDQMPFAPLVAEKDCTVPPFFWTLKVTDLTPLPSVTVALNVYVEPIVALAEGSIPETAGPVVSVALGSAPPGLARPRCGRRA